MGKYRLLPSYLGLALIIGAVLTNQIWIFGIFMLIWIIMDLRNRQTYVFQVISRAENPVFYWMVLSVWLMAAIYYLLHF